MNQGGWGLNDVLGFIAVISVALLITMFMYSRNASDLFLGSAKDSEFEETTYAELEDAMITATKAYLDNFYYKVLENGSLS